MKFGLYIFGLMLWCIVTWFDYVAGEYIDVGLDLIIAFFVTDLLWRGTVDAYYDTRSPDGRDHRYACDL